MIKCLRISNVALTIWQQCHGDKIKYIIKTVLTLHCIPSSIPDCQI